MKFTLISSTYDRDDYNIINGIFRQLARDAAFRQSELWLPRPLQQIV